MSLTLGLVDARTIHAGGFLGGGDWSMRFAPPDTIQVFAIGRGSCRMALDGTPEPGGFFLLSRNSDLAVASDLALKPRPAAEAFAGRGAALIPAGEVKDSNEPPGFRGESAGLQRAGG